MIILNMLPEEIFIKVAFATKTIQKVIALTIKTGTSLKEAIEQSGIQQFFPEYNLAELTIGIFGRRISNINDYQLRSGDRIEIYRPLLKTANQARLERFNKNKHN